MKSLEAKKVSYKLENLVGVGLTSEVYRAIRVDALGLTQQEVALKIIKSKNDVPTLRSEFENLLKIRSKYCVQVHAWENLNSGPALVLEYIEGVTLKTLLESGDLTIDLVHEILAQVRLGLVSLHRHKVFHGDINLKNIMVTREGVIKLIDFGFGDKNQGQYLTPAFSCPTRLEGASPSESTDWESFRLLAAFLLNEPNWSSDQLAHSSMHPRAGRRRSLATRVKKLEAINSEVTVCVSGPKTTRHRSPWRHLVPALVFAFSLFGPALRSKGVSYSPLMLRSQAWFKASINGLPGAYGPVVKKKLRQGHYKILWEGASGQGQVIYDHKGARTFLLQPSVNSL